MTQVTSDRIFLPRLWSVSRVHGYVTPADFIRGRYGSRGLALASAFTGILALMPYIALQLVGIQAVLTVMGVGASPTNAFVKDLPLFIAFPVLAIFTYVSGLRAPALIAFIKEFGHSVYIGLSAVVLNLVIAVAATLVLRAARVPEGVDETLPEQYTADPEQAPAPTPATVGAAP